MNEKLIEQAVVEFSKENKPTYERVVKLSPKSNVIYRVKIERVVVNAILDGVSLESRADFISALPSGSQCPSCKGSGRI